MAGIGATELLIVTAIVMLLFGARRLPEAARALGQSMRILRTETRGLPPGESAEPAGTAVEHGSRSQAGTPDTSPR